MDFNKPRIAMYFNILASTGYRNDGANLFMAYNLKKLLDGVDAYGDPGKMMDASGNIVCLSPIDPTTQFGKFDLNLLIDYGEDGLNIPLNWTIPHPNAYWIADSHLGYDYRLKRAREFDHVFASHKPSIARMIEDGIDPTKIHYLPWAAEPMCYKPFPIVEKYDWCFIGHLNNQFRIDLVDRFCKTWPLGEKGYLGWRQPEFRGHNILEDVAKKFSQSRIVLNESVRDDLNMRVAETIACQRFLLTERVPAVEEFFVDGKDLVLFTTVDEAVDKAKHYLEHSHERNLIAENGYQKFLRGWTYGQRAETILDVCLPGWRSSCPNVHPNAPEYDRRGSLIPSSAIDYHLLSHSHGEQFRQVEEVVQGA